MLSRPFDQREQDWGRGPILSPTGHEWHGPNLHHSGDEVPDRKTYSEKLKDPRWQKKRLKVMERDFWACQNCGETESCLNVHHLVYLPGREPWEYPERCLLTLCEDCHKSEPEMFRRASECFTKQMQMMGVTSDWLYRIGLVASRLGRPAFLMLFVKLMEQIDEEAK